MPLLRGLTAPRAVVARRLSIPDRHRYLAAFQMMESVLMEPFPVEGPEERPRRHGRSH